MDALQISVPLSCWQAQDQACQASGEHLKAKGGVGPTAARRSGVVGPLACQLADGLGAYLALNYDFSRVGACHDHAVTGTETLTEAY